MQLKYQKILGMKGTSFAYEEQEGKVSRLLERPKRSGGVFTTYVMENGDYVEEPEIINLIK